MRHWVHLLLLLSSVACASAQVSPANPPFTITISPESADVAAGQSVFVKLTVKNLTNLPMDISANISDLTGMDPNYTWDVLDERGLLVQKRKYAHPELSGGSPLLNDVLAPGTTDTRTEDLNRLFDLSKSGKYIVAASRPISFSVKKAGMVRSNVITVMVSGKNEK